MRCITKVLQMNQASRLCFSQRHQAHTHAVILGLAIGNPEHRLSQKDGFNLVQKNVKSQGVEKRCTPIYPEFVKYVGNNKTNEKSTEYLMHEACFYPRDSSLDVPLDMRLKKFKEVAIPLANDVALRAMKQSGVAKEDIGMIVFVSSSGLVLPGIDYNVIRHLELKNETERISIGFMGSTGAINGLTVASDFVRNNQTKKALIVCIELNSLHVSHEDNKKRDTSNTLPGDGCAAVVVGAVDDEAMLPKGCLKLMDQHSTLVYETKDTSMLTLCPDGLKATLSKELPSVVQTNVRPFVDTLMARNNITQNDIDFWGIASGGAQIIRAVQHGLDITKHDLTDTWDVLKEYGYMGCPSVFFVLDRILKKHKEMVMEGQKGYKHGFAMAASPGISLEGIYLQII